MIRHLLAIGACLALLTSAAHASTWVLPPEASNEVGRLIGNDRPLSGGQAVAAAIDGDHIVVTLLAGDAVVTRVTLRHPGRAEADAEVIGGVSVTSAPGPVDAALLAELVARMRASGAEVRWIDASAGARGGHEPVAADIAAALRALDLGDSDAARGLLERLPAELTVRERLDAARAWRRVGEPARVQALVGGFDGAGAGPAAAAAALTDAATTPEAVLALAGDGDPCPLIGAADIFAEQDRRVEARALAEQIRTRSPGCARAWTREIRERLRLGDLDGARAALDDALARFPDDRSLAGLDVAVLAADEAAPALDALDARARAKPSAPKRLRALERALAQLPEAERASRVSTYAEALRRDPDDVVARWGVGAAALDDGDPQRARDTLAPLASALPEVPAVAVAVAIADFELGDAAGALARLDAAAAMPELDPLVYYVRAEILRDSDRPAAARALGRYIAGCLSVGCADVAREERAATLTQLLSRCEQEHAPVCEGDWEHLRPAHTPTLANVEAEAQPQPEAADPPPAPAPAPAAPPTREDGAQQTLLWALLIASGALALLGVWAVLRRRRR